MRRPVALLTLPLAGLVAVPLSSAPVPPGKAADGWAMFGGTPGRNMVNWTARGLPDDFDPEKGTRILWKADLGSRSYAQPVVAGGRVYVGTNNERPRNPHDTFVNANGEVEPIDRGVLMCFRASDGKFIWQSVHGKLPGGQVVDWPKEGVCSTPTVVGDRVYYVSNECRVVCLDANGFADGNQGYAHERYRDETDADVLWEYDLIGEQKVFPHNMANGYPLVVGDRLFVQTSNGVDEWHVNLPSPKAPSLVALDRHTGKLLWKDASPGEAIMHSQWSSPSYAEEPVPQVLAAQGDGWLRAFDPKTGALIWKFDCNPKGSKYELGGTGRKCDFIACPVVDRGKVYIGTGQDPEHFTGAADFWCIDLKKAVENGKTSAGRDVSPDLLVKTEKWPGGVEKVRTRPNPASAVVWHFGGEDRRPFATRDFVFGRTMSTACVVGDVLYAAELQGFLHCLDARTGRRYWMYDLKGAVWTSPYYADGKVYMATEIGELFIFRHSADPPGLDADEMANAAPNRQAAILCRREARAELGRQVLLRKVEFEAAIRGVPAVANGVLYVATENTLHAIGRPR
jgi:outer membrane protein assembly factor BamB